MAERQLETANGWAYQLGMSDKTVREALEGVPPDGTRGKSQPTYYLATVWAALLGAADAGELDLNEQKARLAKWQADRVEMDVAVRAGELGVISEVEGWYGNHIERCRSRLIQLPDAIGQFCDARTAAVVVGEARRLTYEALAELAAERPKLVTKDSVAVDPAADPDGQPVGGREPETVERV
jgi:hypothetical protein